MASGADFERLISHTNVEKFWQMEQHGGGSLMRLERERLGIFVLIFVAIFFVFAYLLNREYWKDVH